MSLPLEPGQSFQTPKRACDDPHSNYESIKSKPEDTTPVPVPVDDPSKPLCFWEARELHADTDKDGIRQIRIAMLRKLGAKFLSLLAATEMPWYTTARVLELRKSNGSIDLRVVVICSQQKLNAHEADLLSISPPEEGERKLDDTKL